MLMAKAVLAVAAVIIIEASRSIFQWWRKKQVHPAGESIGLRREATGKSTGETHITHTTRKSRQNELASLYMRL